jgi:hypothetical protein
VQRMFKAIVVMLNAKTSDVSSILAIARTEARRREQSKENPSIRALRYFPEVNVYVAVYEAQQDPDATVEQKR